jgi:hypothetical protein
MRPMQSGQKDSVRMLTRAILTAHILIIILQPLRNHYATITQPLRNQFGGSYGIYNDQEYT